MTRIYKLHERPIMAELRPTVKSPQCLLSADSQVERRSYYGYSHFVIDLGADKVGQYSLPGKVNSSKM